MASKLRDICTQKTHGNGPRNACVNFVLKTTRVENQTIISYSNISLSIYIVFGARIGSKMT
jgi:hypothetical protein